MNSFSSNSGVLNFAGSNMKYHLNGVDATTGEELTVTVKASDEREAEQLGKLWGMYVASVRPDEEEVSGPIAGVPHVEQRLSDPNHERTRTFTPPVVPRRRKMSAADYGNFTLFGGAGLLLVFLLFGRGLFNSNRNSRPAYEPSASQRIPIEAHDGYQRELRATSDRTGHSMDSLNRSVQQFRNNGVPGNSTELLRAAEDAHDLAEVLRSRKND